MTALDELIPDLGVEGLALREEGTLGPGLELPQSGEALIGIPLDLLRALDYRGGRVRLWTDRPGDDVTESVAVVVLEFADAAAAGALIDAEASLIAVLPEVSRFVPFDGAGLSGSLLHGEGFVATSIFAIDRYAVFVAAESATAERAVEVAQAVTPAQVVAAERHLGGVG